MSIKKIAVLVRMIKKTWEADFTIIDESDLPIASAAVAVDNNASVSSDAGGLTKIGPLNRGTHNFTVTHPDYDTDSGSFIAE